MWTQDKWRGPKPGKMRGQITLLITCPTSVLKSSSKIQKRGSVEEVTNILLMLFSAKEIRKVKGFGKISIMLFLICPPSTSITISTASTLEIRKNIMRWLLEVSKPTSKLREVLIFKIKCRKIWIRLKDKITILLWGCWMKFSQSLSISRQM